MTQNTAASPVTTTCLGFTAPIDAVVLGARSGIGEAFLNELSAMNQVRTIYGTSRAAHWAQLESTSTKIRRCEVDIVDETSVKAFAERLKQMIAAQIWSSTARGFCMMLRSNQSAPGTI